MQLMSSFLLCVIVAAMPEVLGSHPSVIFNTTKHVNAEGKLHKKVLLNVKSPLVNINTNLQSVFKDKLCEKCISCMERAIKAFQTEMHKSAFKPNILEMYNDILSEYQRKARRAINKEIDDYEDKDSNKRKSSPTKDISLTKYLDEEGKPYAVRIKEYDVFKNTSDAKRPFTCTVYTIKQTFPCDSVRPETITISPKKRSKKSKKPRVSYSRVSTTTNEPKTFAMVYKKRDLDLVSDTYMTSIEDLFDGF